VVGPSVGLWPYAADIVEAEPVSQATGL
jgi:hypothetical protein